MTRATEERVIVSTVVAASPEEAFRVFTHDIDRWWRRSPRYRRCPGERGALAFEGEPPSALVERDGDRSVVVGRVLAWEPGRRLAFEWSGYGLELDDGTWVEVRFTPHPRGARVELEHSGLAALPPEHAARRGFQGEAFEAMFGYFWADLLTSLRARAGG